MRKTTELQVWSEDTCPASTDTLMPQGKVSPPATPGHRVCDTECDTPCDTQVSCGLWTHRVPSGCLQAGALQLRMCSSLLKANGNSLQCLPVKFRILSRHLPLEKIFIFCFNWCTDFMLLILSDTAQGAFSGFMGDCLSFDTRSQQN